MSHRFELVAPFEPQPPQEKAISALVEGLSAGLRRQSLLGITGCGKTFVMANVIARTQRPCILLAHNKTLAAQLYSEMRRFFPNNAVEYFVSYYDYYQPEAYVVASDTYIAKDASVNETIEQMRLSATKALLEREDTLIIASVSAIYGLGDPAQYLKMVLHLRVGHQLDQRDMLRQLASMQYTRNDIALKRGTYRVHGDVIDIHPADCETEAIRVELFDDVIEALRLFDVVTGEVTHQLNRYTVHPKTHYVTPKETLKKASGAIEKELQVRLRCLNDAGLLLEAQRLEQRTRFDLEMMAELGYCTGIENYSRYLSGRDAGQAPPTLIDYLPSHGVLMIDESHVTLPQIRGMYRGDRSRKETLVTHGFRLPSAMDNRPLMFEEFLSISPQTIDVSATLGPYEREHADQTVSLTIRPTGLLDPQVEVRPQGSQVDDALSEITASVSRGERVLVTTLTKKMAEQLADYLKEHAIKVRYLHSDIDTVERVELLHGLRQGLFDVLVGINLLREGLDLPEVALVLILDADTPGFLRSSSALIQTIGRAARHVKGRAILYADDHTDAMKEAIETTLSRRVAQMAYNEEHGITPTSVAKPLNTLLDTPQSAAAAGVSESDLKIKRLSPAEFSAHLDELEKTMYDHAESLEFEKAGAIRDKIQSLKEQYFASPGSNA